MMMMISTQPVPHYLTQYYNLNPKIPALLLDGGGAATGLTLLTLLTKKKLE